MIIRQATIEDASAITGLLQQLGHPLRETDVEQKIHFFAQKDCRLLVCEISGRPEGFIALHWFDKFHSIGKTMRITALCVNESFRSGGAGTALITAAETLASEKNCREIEVTSNKRRELTPAFYRKQGYDEQSWHFVKSLTTSSHG